MHGPFPCLTTRRACACCSRFKRYNQRVSTLPPMSSVRLLVKDNESTTGGAVLVSRRAFVLVNTGKLSVHVSFVVC